MGAIERGSGNVYKDLGLPNAGEMQVKANLSAEICEAIRHCRLAQIEASEVLGISQTRLLRILLGQFRDVSEAKLRDCLKKLGSHETGLGNGQ